MPYRALLLPGVLHVQVHECIPLFFCFQISLDTFHWTPMTFAVIAFSLLSFFIFLPSLYSPSGFYNLFPNVFYDLGVHSHLLGTAVFWFSLLLGVTMCFLPIVAIRFSAATVSFHCYLPSTCIAPCLYASQLQITLTAWKRFPVHRGNQSFGSMFIRHTPMTQIVV